MKAHMGLVTLSLTVKSRDALNPMDILKFLYYWTFLLCSMQLIALSLSNTLLSLLR